MSMTVSTGDLRKIKMRIKAMSKRVQNPEPAWRKMGSYFAAANRRQFSTHGMYYGTPWKPLKPDYLQWKIKNGYSRRTLVKTGSMRVSFTSRPMAIERYYKDSAVFGSNHEIAPFQHYGTFRNGKRAIPPRPIMVKTRKVVRDVKQIMQDYITGSKISTRSYI